MSEIKTTHDRNDLATRPLPHYPEPKSDNQRLLNYQYEYKIKGDTAALEGMYNLGCKIAGRFINAEAEARGFYLCASDREEKARNAITYIIARYLRVKDFAITKSFTGYLFLRIKHELYYQRKVDKIVKFVDMETFYRGAKN